MKQPIGIKNEKLLDQSNIKEMEHEWKQREDEID